MKKAKTNRILVYAVVFAAAALLVAAVIAVGLLVQNAEIKRERIALVEQIEELKAQRDKGADDLEYMNTVEWVQKKARALGFITADEEIWVLLDRQT